MIHALGWCPIGLAEEVALHLGATMVDCLCRFWSPVFPWNVGIMMPVIRSDPAVRALEHVQLAQVQLGGTSPASSRVSTSDHALCMGKVEHCHQMLF